LRRPWNIEPRSFEAHHYLALTQERLGRVQLAEQSLRRTIELRPEWWGGHNTLGLFLVRHAQYAEGESYYQQAKKLAPDNPVPYINLASLYIKRHQLAEAERELKESLSKRRMTAALNNLAAVYYRQDRCREAADLLKEAVELGEDAMGWGNLADAYRCAKESASLSSDAYRKAIELAQQSLAVNPKDAETMALIALYYAQLGDIKKALLYAQNARDLTPDSAFVLLRRIKVYELAHRRRDALNAVEAYLAAGYSRAAIDDDRDLAPLRADPRYLALLANTN
jgi:Flp pilus assembly protein TadD